MHFIFCIRNKLCEYNEFELLDSTGFAVYVLDKLCEKMPPGQEKFVAIGDLKGWGYSNSDLRAYLGALSILQVNPEPHFINTSLLS